MNKTNSQVLNAILIIAGGGILLYTIAVEEQKYLQILGFIIIMLGLYRATNHWVETKDDHKEGQDQQEKEG